jgi:hypothetical protein
MKSTIKTLDGARNRISELELELAKAAKAKNNGQPNSVLSDSVLLPAQDGAATKSKAELKLPPVTEESLLEAIRAETDYRKKWAMQRTLATMQTARAVEQANARRPIGVCATISRADHN